MKLVFGDVETTGLSHYIDKIVEIALVVEGDGGGIIPFHRYIRYDSYPSHFRDAFEVSGITIDQLEEEGLPPRQVYEEMLAWLKMNTGYMIRTNHVFFAGHNSMFDVQFIDKFMSDYYHKDTDEMFHKVFSRPSVDTMSMYAEGLIKGKLPDTSSFKLQTLCGKMNVKVDKFHSAIDDAIASLHLHRAIWDQIDNKSEQLQFC